MATNMEGFFISILEIVWNDRLSFLSSCDGVLTGVVMSVVTMEFAWLKASCWKKFPSVTSYQPLTEYRQT